MSKYNVGDTVWYHNGTGRLIKGSVIMVVDLPNYASEQYIVETPTHIEPVLVIRDWWTLSGDGKKLNAFDFSRGKS